MCHAGALRKASAGGTTTLTMERGEATIVFKGVPASVCNARGRQSGQPARQNADPKITAEYVEDAKRMETTTAQDLGL